MTATPAFKPITSLALLMLLAFCSTGYVQAQTSGSENNDPMATIVDVSAGLSSDIRTLEQANRATRKDLRSDERTLKATEISPARLEEARLDLSAARTQLDSIDARLRARSGNLQALDNAIEELRSEANNAEAESALTARVDVREALTKLIAQLEQLRAATRTQATLSLRKLELLQQRFDLDELRPVIDTSSRRAALQTELDRHIREASSIRGELRSITANTPTGAARKRLLDVRALDASERAELKGNELALLERSRAVTQLAGISDNRAMPEHALRKGRDNLTAIQGQLVSQGDALSRKLEVISEQRTIVEQRGAIAQGANSTLSEQIDIVDSLSNDITAQNKRVDNLIKTAERADNRFVSAIGVASRTELLKRRSLPEDGQAWRELGADLSSLPGRIVANLWGAVQAVGQRIAQASLGMLLILVVLEGLLIAGILWLRRFLDRTLIQKDLDRGAVLPMCALYWSLPALIPAAVLMLLGVVLSVSTINLILLLTLLLIWPAIKFALKMSFYLLVDEAPPESMAVRERLHRELTWVLTLVGFIIGLSVVARVVALSPSVLDMLERFTMVCLLLVALPALHVRAVILARSEQDLKESGFWIRVAGALSLLAPVVLIGCALIGLVGYVRLAWAITTHMGWLALIAAGWFLVESALHDGAIWLSKRVNARAGESADFWNQNIINPAYKLIALALAVVAAFILFAIFGWNTQTPVIRWIPELLKTDLVTLGETTIHVREVVVAILVVVGVFWLGSWSKQVSFKFAYSRIGDHGIRQSLSTFTQYIVVVVGLYIALKTIGLDLTALTVFAGALGVGIGFGLQNITSNFISGILLLIERPLRVSDIVNVEGIDGTVTHIGIRAIKVRTFEQQEVVVPNSSIITKPFTNWTGGDDIYRTMFYIRISYDTDPHQAIDIITEIVKAQAGVVTTPAPKVVLNDFTESCMLIRAQYFTHVLGDVGLLDARSQILFAIWDAFRKAGIKIPFPQQDVHLKQINNGPAGALGEDSPPGEPV